MAENDIPELPEWLQKELEKDASNTDASGDDFTMAIVLVLGVLFGVAAIAAFFYLVF